MGGWEVDGKDYGQHCDVSWGGVVTMSGWRAGVGVGGICVVLVVVTVLLLLLLYIPFGCVLPVRCQIHPTSPPPFPRRVLFAEMLRTFYHKSQVYGNKFTNTGTGVIVARRLPQGVICGNTCSDGVCHVVG